jgi:hypothetical protein
MFDGGKGKFIAHATDHPRESLAARLHDQATLSAGFRAAFEAVIKLATVSWAWAFHGAATAFARRRRHLLNAPSLTVLLALPGVILAFGGRDAHAQWRYLDATSANTGPSSAFLPGSNNQADDNLWSTRTGFSSSSNFFQSGDGNGENSPQIFTTVGGLTAGVPYAVNVHFWVAEPWSVAPTILVEGNRTMYAGQLGFAKANGSGQVTVYIDDLPSNIGVNNRTWYDGVSITPTLTLRVNTVTGALSLRNETGAPIDLKYYEIRSNSGAFDPIVWNSLDNQEGGDPIGTGWDEAGGSTANILSEYNLNGSRLMNPNNAAYLGRAYAGAMQDIAFFYSIPNQNTLTAGFVDYVTTPALLGDFNGDDVVDAADLAQWRGDVGVNDDSDADLDGDSDGDDFLIWQRQLGATATPIAAAALAVPEPSACVAAASAILISFCRRR